MRRRYTINKIIIHIGPETWSGDELEFTFGSAPKLQISIPDIAANICEGSILDVSTMATVSNADAGGAYSIALTDGGGTNTFNPSYATVSGDVIKIASNCPQNMSHSPD